ncbi:MAG: Uma2 family endonuclease [Timaviella obliquedivisa GSE-PSE-MK23-08B]|jgi:Uma2 family endonuclease|nr:Uma2 family endonuclease [Timaviella obliquedivisa GSE-PSE-MK23-08B]
MTHTPVKATFPQRDRPSQGQRATWADYLTLCDDPSIERIRIFFDEGWMWTEMGEEGLNHSSVCDLFTMLILCWKMKYPERQVHSLGRCQLEKTGHKACAPDLVVYLGEPPPRWQPGQRRFVNLDKAGLPALVGEVSDTTLANDLDRKKHLYAALGIPEYWVIDVRGKQVLAFLLQADGSYAESETSEAFAGLAIALLEQTLERLDQEANTDAALWFSQQLAT